MNETGTISPSAPSGLLPVRTLSLREVNAMSVLALAHVGDAVYELLVRTRLAVSGPATAGELHRKTVAIVRAEAQAKAVRRILPDLTEEETAVYRRGRNGHVHGIPSHASPGEYHSATGLETLLGWLWLQGKTERVTELFSLLFSDDGQTDTQH